MTDSGPSRPESGSPEPPAPAPTLPAAGADAGGDEGIGVGSCKTVPRTMATPRERAAWCLYDFANSAFATIVVTFVYSVYFAKVVVGDETTGQAYWGWALTLSAVAVALVSPILGDYADRSAHKKHWLVGLALTSILLTASLFWPGVPTGASGASGGWIAWCWIAFVVANFAFETMFVFYNAYLPGLGDPATLGRLSGKGWALGFVGGLLCLVLCLGCIGVEGESGYLLGPWLSADDHLNVRATNLIVAGWFLLFGLPMFLLVRDHTPRLPNAEAPSIGSSFRGVFRTLRELPRYPDLLRFLLARIFYNDALIALIGLAGLYMNDSLGMSVSEIMLTAIWLNVVAGIGAFAFGYVDDWFGARTAVLWSLVLLLAGAVLAIAVPTQGAFMGAATLVGLGMGPNQASSRTLLARLIDSRHAARYYGLYALSGKATAWLGTLLFTLVVSATGDQRLALTPLIVMFALGLALILTVNEKRGQANPAGAED